MAASDNAKEEETVLRAVAASAIRDIEAITANHKNEIVALRNALTAAVKQASLEVEILKKLTKLASKDVKKILFIFLTSVEVLFYSSMSAVDGLLCV